ncbi:MAG: hypothetical protein PHD29_00435 [bacterium]|nr:hypothetical protein [bacterium]
MPKLLQQDEKQIEHQFRIVAMQEQLDEEKLLVKDYSFVLGLIMLVIGLLVYTISIVFGGALMAMGLAAIIYRFLPW